MRTLLFLALLLLLVPGCGGGGGAVPDVDDTPPFLSMDVAWPGIVRYQCDSNDDPCPAVPDLGSVVRTEGQISVPRELYDTTNTREVTVTLVGSDSGGVGVVGVRLVFDVDIVDAGGAVVMSGGPGTTLLVRRQDPTPTPFDLWSLQIVLRLSPGDTIAIRPWAEDYGGMSGAPNRTDLDGVDIQVENS